MLRPITRRPVQAADYGKDIMSAPARCEDAKPEDAGKAQTDGRKTLALWSR
jgi:hypothetical protein